MTDFGPNENDQSTFYRFIAFIVIICLTMILAGASIMMNFDNWAERGQFGDMFGVVNTFFSGCAFAGLIYAIAMQHQELALQREELRLTREELARAAAAQEEAKKALQQQADMARQSNLLQTSNYLMAFYTERRNTLHQQYLSMSLGQWVNSPESQESASVDKKISEIRKLIDSTYDEIVIPALYVATEKAPNHELQSGQS